MLLTGSIERPAATHSMELAVIRNMDKYDGKQREKRKTTGLVAVVCCCLLAYNSRQTYMGGWEKNRKSDGNVFFVE